MMMHYNEENNPNYGRSRSKITKEVIGFRTGSGEHCRNWNACVT